MKIISTALSGFILAASSTMADNRDLSENEFRIGVADVGWTVIEQYQGTKLLLDAHLVFDRVDEPANENKDKERLNYLFDAHLQFGDYQNRLDYLALAYTYRAYQINRNLLSARSLQIVRDQVELAKLIAGYDDTLNIDYYAELQAGRVGRFWSYRPSGRSSFTFTLGLNASLGWAWVESVDQRYAPVSNPVIGLWSMLALEHGSLGQLYVDRRTKNGFNFGIPNQTNSREANLRFGYRKDFSGCVALDIFAEKRSFLFAAFDMRDLYDKTSRYGMELLCRFR